MTKPLSKLHFYLTEGQNLACRVCASQQPAAGPERSNGKPRSAHPVLEPFTRPAAPGKVEASSFPAFLSIPLFQKALEEALPLGVETVTLTGGEPFSHPDLVALLDILDRRPVRIIIETNGHGLTPAHAARLACLKRSPCHVAVGLKGADALTHDRLTGLPGSFETATQAIHLLRAAGVPVKVAFSLVRQNAGQLCSMVALAETMGAYAALFNPILPGCAGLWAGPAAPGKNGHTFALTVEELIAIGRRLERDIAPHTPLHLVFEQPPAFRGLSPSFPSEAVDSCSVYDSLSILPGGEVSLCGAGMLAPALVLGQVAVETIPQIWRDHPVLTELRENLPSSLQGTCTRCSLRSSCLGHCLAQNYFQRGSFFGPYWFCEAAERAGLFPASRLEEV